MRRHARRVVASCAASMGGSAAAFDRDDARVIGREPESVRDEAAGFGGDGKAALPFGNGFAGATDNVSGLRLGKVVRAAPVFEDEGEVHGRRSFEDAFDAVPRVVEGDIFTAKEGAAAPVGRAVAAAAEAAHFQPAARGGVGGDGELNEDFAAIGVVVNDDAGVDLARGGCGAGELLGGDALRGGVGFGSEAVDRVGVHLLDGIEERVAEDFEALVEERGGEDVAAVDAGEAALAFGEDGFIAPVVAHAGRGLVVFVRIFEADGGLGLHRRIRRRRGLRRRRSGS